LAGLLYILAPFNIRTIFFAGNLPRTLTLVLIPLSFYFVLRLLGKSGRLNSLGLALTVMALVLAHQMQALMVLLGLGAFVVAFFIINNEPIKKTVPVILSGLFGVWLSLWWLIPAVTNFDLANVPYLKPEQVAVYSLTLRNFDPFYAGMDPAIVYPSLALIAAAALGLAIVRSRMALCLFLAAALMLFLSFGTTLPFWWNIPFSQSLLPWRFLNVAYFPLSVLAAWGLGRLATLKSPHLGLRWLAVVGAAAILAVIYLDYQPRFDLIRGRDLGWLQKPVSTMTASAANDGRFAYFSGHMLSEIAYVPIVDGGRLLSDGWAFEGTIHNDTIRRMGFAYRKGFPQFLARTYALWNARRLILDNEHSSARPALEQAGWMETGKGEGFSMLSNPRPSSYLMYQDRSALAIGYTAPWVGLIYPWVSTGPSPYVDDYPLQFLNQFDILILSNFRYRDSRKLDQILRTLMSQDKMVVID
ncbi:MAG: 6-pyruvoyl-tetrahydropterin synthase-related protein, partial [Dehalococcoidia bacterium]|nr:6-pyruvoyl-tetrahydropterin synthase-related protein [Dehalococcoidia bacterium]